MLRLAYSGFLLLLIIACGEGDRSVAPLRIAVAANARYAADSLAVAFQARSGIPVEIISSSSGKLAAQIREGAPYAVFLSADMDYPRALTREGQQQAPPVVYARGRLVIWSKTHPLDSLTLARQLAGSEGKIALPNPALAPYGRAAEAWLRREGIYEAVAPRLVFGESIAQVNQFVLSEAAAYGFTALAVMRAAGQSSEGYYQLVPEAGYSSIEQGMIITRYGAEQQAGASRLFYDFVLGDEGRAILRRFGYAVAEAE